MSGILRNQSLRITTNIGEFLWVSSYGAEGPPPSSLLSSKQHTIIYVSIRCHHRSNILFVVLNLLNKRGWKKSIARKASPEKHRQKSTSLKLPKWTHLTSFKDSVNIVLVFLNKRGWWKASPENNLSCIIQNKPRLYVYQFVVIIVQTFCK